MAIGTDSLIEFFGTLDVLDDTSTATVADDAFSEASVTWTNDDDAPEGFFVLECQFDTTAPTDGVGSIDLYAQLLDINDSTGDAGVPSATNLNHYVGSFPIDWTVAADTNYFSWFRAHLPNGETSQQYVFYFHNNGTGQTIGVDWNMWVRPITVGPHG